MITFMGKEHNVDINSQSHCNDIILEHITDGILTNELAPSFSMLKINKNQNIKDRVETLLKSELKNYCLFAYGPHIQKLLSVVEIFKSKQKDMNLIQYNKLQNFEVVENGPNELIEKKIRVPVLICFLLSDKSLCNRDIFRDESNQFTKQDI